MGHPTSERELNKAREELSKLGVDRVQRHIFLCVDTDRESCAGKRAMEESWDYLKRRLKELKLADAGGTFRSKTHCLRVCKGGPIAVVYPDAVWYGNCHPQVLEQIIQQHLVGGNMVREFVIGTGNGCGSM